MLNVLTPLSKVHRASRRVDKDTFIAAPGLWAYINSSGVLANIASTSTNQTQPQVLKIVLGNASSNQYESNDIEVGSISTVEGYFRASADTNGYQKLASDGTSSLTYAQGAALTPAYLVTGTGDSSVTYAAAADIGKLRPAATGDVVVARVENIDSTNNVLTFETVTPYTMA